jgi:glutaredoxin-like protein NrdH
MHSFSVAALYPWSASDSLPPSNFIVGCQTAEVKQTLPIIGNCRRSISLSNTSGTQKANRSVVEIVVRFVYEPVSGGMHMKVKHVPGKNRGHIMLYALSTCGWCRKTKRLLNNLGLEYYYVDVDLLGEEEKDQAMKSVRLHNPQGSFPTMVIDEKKCIVGYDEDRINQEVGK